MAIEGILDISVDQEDHMLLVNAKHKDSVGSDYKDGLTIEKVWLDKNKTICVRVKNGEYYHYYADGTWG